MADKTLIRSILHSSKDNLITLFISVSVILTLLYASRKRHHSSNFSSSKAVEPPMLTSWLPWIGSGFDYMLHPLTFLKIYSNQHNHVFKFKLFGQTIVAISSPTAISNLFSDRSGSFESVNGQNIHLLTGTSISEDRVPYIYSVLRQRAALPVHRALMPSRLPIISSRLTEELLKALKTIELTNRRYSLNDFVHRTLYTATSLTLLGPDFPVRTYENFMIWDDGAPLQLRHLGMFGRAANVAREALFASWTQHFVEHWVPEKGGYLMGAVDMMSDVYRGLKQSNLTHNEVHRLMFVILWAIHTNLLELTTWVMCHIITDKDIYTRVCQEIRSFVNQHFPHIDDITQIDPMLLDDDAFRFLNSVVQEVIRTKTALGPMRVATRDAVVIDEDDKKILIGKGEIIAINLAGMYHSPNLQGEPETFKADRFLNGETYRSYAFGSGKHSCAGRNYVKFAVRQFIILILAMYDIQLRSDAINGSGSLPDSDGGMGLKLSLFSRRGSDLSIAFHPYSVSDSMVK